MDERGLAALPGPLMRHSMGSPCGLRGAILEQTGLLLDIVNPGRFIATRRSDLSRIEGCKSFHQQKPSFFRKMPLMDVKHQDRLQDPEVNSGNWSDTN